MRNNWIERTFKYESFGKSSDNLRRHEKVKIESDKKFESDIPQQKLEDPF